MRQIWPDKEMQRGEKIQLGENRAKSVLVNVRSPYISEPADGLGGLPSVVAQWILNVEEINNTNLVNNNKCGVV